MKRISNFAVLFLALMAITFVGLSSPARASSAATPVMTPGTPIPSSPATKVVKTFYTALTETMKQGDQLGFYGRFKMLQPIVASAFDLPLMTRVAVGSPWNSATADEQKQLISAFSDFSVANYASRFAKYNNERFDVMDEKPAAGGGVIVETMLSPKDSDPVMLNYLLKTDTAGEFRIVDVLLDGSISELANRRAEFTSIVQRDGISALVNSLGDKTKQMGPS
jgi:phospholipid transport system substrate-binding protein